MNAPQPVRTGDELEQLGHSGQAPTPEQRILIRELGRAVYTQHVEAHLKPDDHGKYVAIDVNSGDYEIDADDLTAMNRLQERQPTAVLWTVRAGWGFTERLGAR